MKTTEVRISNSYFIVIFNMATRSCFVFDVLSWQATTEFFVTLSTILTPQWQDHGINISTECLRMKVTQHSVFGSICPE